VRYNIRKKNIGGEDQGGGGGEGKMKMVKMAFLPPPTTAKMVFNNLLISKILLS
jgi:hypothetical protein